MRPTEFESGAGVRTARGGLWSLALPLVVLASMFAFGVDRANAADCQFVLGFAALQAAAPDTVGDCLEDELHHPGDGITRQQTTAGILLWRKADNHTSFTDGHRTWVAGPQGLQQRPVGERFAWESDAARLIRIGAVVSETGRFVEEGNAVRRGYRLWANWVNGEYGGLKVGDERYWVELVMYDDAGEAAATRTLVERLITEDQVDFLLGPYSSGLTQSAIEVAEAHDRVLVTASGGAESLFTQGFENYFAVQTPAAQYTRSALQILAAEGAGSVVIAHADSTFAASVAEGARRWADEYGLDVLAVDDYSQGSADLSSVVASANVLEPDVFIGGGHFNDAILFLRAARDLDFQPAGDGNYGWAQQPAIGCPARFRRRIGNRSDAVGSVDELCRRIASGFGGRLCRPFPGSLAAGADLSGGRLVGRSPGPAARDRGRRLS